MDETITWSLVFFVQLDIVGIIKGLGGKVTGTREWLGIFACTKQTITNSNREEGRKEQLSAFSFFRSP